MHTASSLVPGIRLGQVILVSDAFKDLGAEPLKRVHPNCRHFDYDSDTYWECVVRSDTLTGYHPVGTCRMGPDGDQSSVVDPQLR